MTHRVVITRRVQGLPVSAECLVCPWRWVVLSEVPLVEAAEEHYRDNPHPDRPISSTADLSALLGLIPPTEDRDG